MGKLLAIVLAIAFVLGGLVYLAGREIGGLSGWKTACDIGPSEAASHGSGVTVPARRESR
jgi:hypothetical protein